MAVGLLQCYQIIEQVAHFLFPFSVHTSPVSFVLQVVEHGVDGFRLLTDGMYTVLRHADFKVHEVVEIATRSKSVRQKAIEYLGSHAHKVLLFMCFAVLDLIECVEQHAPAKTYLYL